MLPLSKEMIALRVAREIKDGQYVNLGIGLPTLVSSFIPEHIKVTLHAENGVLGYGRLAQPEEIIPELVDAGSQPITLKTGAAFFDSATAFSMIRGGYMDAAVLGALQVSEKGDLAGWSNPDRGFPEQIGNIGGSMDLAVGAKKVIIAMMHTQNTGEPKIVRECAYPITARGVVKLIVTDLAVISVTPKGLLLREVAPGLTAADVQSVTEPKLIISPDLTEIQL